MASALNRVIWNTIEQTIPFVFLLFVVGTLNPFKWTENHFIHLVRMFIISRVIYSVSYIGIVLTGFWSLKAYGHVGTLLVNFTLLLAVFGINVFKYVAMLPLPKK